MSTKIALNFFLIIGFVVLFFQPMFSQDTVNNSINIYDPRGFITIYECEDDGKGCEDKIPILYRNAYDKIFERVNFEVGINSKILIGYDLPMNNSDFEAEISIKGRIGDRKIEIPGYSIIGEQEVLKYARVGSATKLIGTLTAIIDIYI